MVQAVDRYASSFGRQATTLFPTGNSEEPLSMDEERVFRSHLDSQFLRQVAS
jgi:hypothetical protein